MKKFTLLIFALMAIMWQSNAQAPPCTYDLVIADSYGDGWDGASLDVSINGVVTNYTTTGAGDTYQFTLLNAGDTLEVTYYSGSYESEHSYTLTDCLGAIVFSDGPSPATGLVYIQAPPPPIDPNCGGNAYTSISGATIDSVLPDVADD